jgi:hypothetical protein
MDSRIYWNWPSYQSLLPIIHLSMKEGTLFLLFCLYLWDPPNGDASYHILGLFGKLSMRRGAWAWFHDIWTCGAKVLEYWMISSLKIKLNHSWKFWKNWNVPLVLLETFWWLGFYVIYLVRFHNVGNIDFEIILLLQIEINSQNSGFGRKNQLRMW